MQIQSFKWLMAGAVMMAGLSGCGGGGGSTPAPTTQVPAGNTAIKGTAAAGIIYPGMVNVYAVDANGNKGMLLSGPVLTTIDGTYNAKLGGYSGAILVEASGTYTDEATGKSMTIAPAKPLHALVDKVDETSNNNRVVAVTPLTEVAWRKASAAGAKPTPVAAIANTNKLVGDLFKLGDIVGIEPVRPDNASMANASHESKAYTLALATLSQLAATKTGATDDDKFENLLSGMTKEVEDAETSGRISANASDDFATALGNVSLGDDFPSAKDQLAAIGRKSQTITLATSGTLPAGTKIFAIQGIMALPADPATKQLKVSLRADSNGQALSDVFLLAGDAAGMKGVAPFANFEAPQQQVIFSVLLDASGAGIGIGDFATLTYEVANGFTVSPTDFSLVDGSVMVKDANGSDISGVTLTLK